MSYSVDKVLSQEQLHRLREYEQKLQYQNIDQYYNLFSLQKCNDPGPRWYRDLLEGYYNRKIHASYFLRYGVGSFTKAHRDDNRVTDRTIVTFIRTDNLLGGESLIFEPIPGLDKDGQWQKPVVVPEITSGKSLIYDTDMVHSVAKVHRGLRNVHICWFKTKQTH